MSELCLRRVENFWKKKTEKSNTYFDNEQYNTALEGYQEALLRAEILLVYRNDAMALKIPFLQIYIISCNNLAEAYEKLKLPTKGVQVLEKVLHQLLFLFKEGEIDAIVFNKEMAKAIVNFKRYKKQFGLVTGL